MNKYFGKTSQKLCIAGFVVCAAIAPILRLEALQDFVVNTAAPMILGADTNRFLNELDTWTSLLRGLCRDIPICLMLCFGFLYCLATPFRFSCRFKGTCWQELKDFFHEKRVFNKRNARILLSIFAITFIGFFALIRSGVGYNDDLGRQISGSFGWMFSFARVVTEVLNLAIHGAYLIHDRSPLGQVIAMGFLSVAALVMAIAFSGLSGRREGAAKLGWHNVAAAMIIVFNPYFLDGIAFKYDSPGMALSILFPLVPFLFVGTARLYTISSFFCVLGMYLSYQTSSGIYIMMVIFIALLKYLAEEWTLGETVKFCAKSASLFIVASMVFFLLSRFLTTDAYRSTSVSIGFNVIKNILRYLLRIIFNFNATWIALSLLVAGSAAFAVCRLSKKKLAATLSFFALALVLAIILSQGSFIFLTDPAHNARGKYGFGALLAILASISVLSVPHLSALWKKALAAAPAVLLAWSFFTYASAFGNAHANQMKMVLQYEALVREDINTLFPQEEYPQLEISFVGVIPWSGEVKNLIKTYPITDSLLRRRTGITMTYFDPTLKLITKDDPPAPIEEMTLLLGRRYYDILLEEGTGRVIVECKMEES